jgi:hypothetical protein
MNSTTDISEPAVTFDPDHFTVVPARMFRVLRVHEIFRAPSRTLTDVHATAIQAVSADNHPIHYDVEYARRHGPDQHAREPRCGREFGVSGASASDDDGNAAGRR